ncbi:unnamed protein product [Heterobilharzia americana]|nr:unnamed protein product [Heterobilharzia americana]
MLNRRQRQSLYDSDAYAIDSKPELKASHGPNFTQITCRVNRPKPNAEIYLTCPALGENKILGNCYQGCQPTNPCLHSTQQQFGCVPHDQTVFCQKMEFPNGSILLNLKVDRTDKRLTGLWSCTHAGLESTKFEIDLKSYSNVNEMAPEPKQSAIQDKHEGDKSILKSVHSDRVAMLNDRPLAYMRKPEILFTVLAILALSILINLAFCIRCLLLRSYIDASNEGSSKTDCLAACLCLPDEIKKGSLIMTTPVLPRANITSHMNHVRINGSDHGVFNSSYSLSAIQKVPLLYNGASYKDNLSPAYVPTNSLPGTFRKHGMQNLRNVSTPQQYGGSLIHSQPLDMENNNLTMVEDTNKFVNFTPTYIRAPSLNTPSPNLNRDVANNYGYSPQTAIHYIGQGEIHSFPQYLIRVQHPHVIYDDVAAGTSSVVGSLGHSPNGSILDATNLQGHLAHFSNINASKQNNISQPVNSSFSNMVNLSSDPPVQSHYISLQPSVNSKPVDDKVTTSTVLSISTPGSAIIPSNSMTENLVHSRQTTITNSLHDEETIKDAQQYSMTQMESLLDSKKSSTNATITSSPLVSLPSTSMRTKESNSLVSDSIS